MSIKFFDYAWRFLITNGMNERGPNPRRGFRIARRRILSDAVFVGEEFLTMNSALITNDANRPNNMNKSDAVL